MGKNLQYQFLYTINNAFAGGGKDKHSIRASGRNTTENVYSYAERKNLVDISAQFSSFIKKSHPSIKMVRDITSDHIQQFLNKKSENCSSETLSQYAARFRKLETLANKTYKLELNWRDIVVPASRIAKNMRNIAMEKNDLEKIMNNIAGSKSQAKNAIELAYRFGLRVAETVKLQPRDIDLKKMRIHIHESKGARSRDLDIRPEDVKFLKKLIGSISARKTLVSIKEDSVNRFLSRTFLRLGLLKYAVAKSGVHLLRKMRAQELYDEMRSKGMSRTESLEIVSKYLGHGKNRKELLKRYILDIW